MHRHPYYRYHYSQGKGAEADAPCHSPPKGGRKVSITIIRRNSRGDLLRMQQPQQIR